MKPYLDDGDVQLYHGEALSVLAGLPSESVHCIVTSPPYWGLRDYGTGEWTGGDANCDHLDVGPQNRAGRETPGGRGGSFPTSERGYRDVCGRCGAQRVDSQLGLEATPGEYVERLVVTLREARRVLRHDGTLWLNLGDSYYSATATQGRNENRSPTPTLGAGHGADGRSPSLDAQTSTTFRRAVDGLKPKDLCGVPWRVAFALQDDGWWLRSDIIWSKPNPMPESVTDRPTRSHEYVFLLTKSARYSYDADAIRQPHRWQDAELLATNAQARQGARLAERRANGDDSVVRTQPPIVREKGRGKQGNRESEFSASSAGRNRRSVWTIATAPYAEAHFATFPPKLVEPCIMAGTGEAGCCSVCGAPRRRVVERESVAKDRNSGRNWLASTEGVVLGRESSPNCGLARDHYTSAQTLGWEPSCSHDAPSKPCTVLDPFAGSGTTMLVARQHGRRSIGIDLSAEYLELAARRLQQQSLFALGHEA